jgi:SAM-dependent methyltransferase
MSGANAYYSARLGVETYDLLVNCAGAITGDVAFYLDCAREFGGPVLELGCGTGRVLTELAKAGHEVMGLDLSSVMLAVAQEKIAAEEKIAKRATLCQGDMSKFDLGEKFSLVLIPARAFHHLIDPKAQRAALNCVHRHLDRGGHLVIDLFDPRLDLLTADGASSPREVRQDGGDTITRHVVSRELDFVGQVLRERLRIERIDSEGRVVASEETGWALRWMMRQEVVYLLELCGFEVFAEYSDFQRSPPAYGKEQVWVARAV